MAGRNNTSCNQRAREKIQTSQLINRLQENALGSAEIMTAGQVRSALALINKTLPDLKALEVQLEAQIDARIGWCDPHTLQSETVTGEST